MKKLISLFLICLLAFGAVASAEGIDLAAMSNDELTDLYEMVKAEMIKRNIPLSNAQTLIEGRYIIGKDVQAGSYTITCTETVGDTLQSAYSGLGSAYSSIAGGSDLGNMFGGLGSMMSEIGMTIEILGDYGEVLKTTMLKTSESIVLVLEEGTALNIVDGKCTLEQNF